MTHPLLFLLSFVTNVSPYQDNLSSNQLLGNGYNKIFEQFLNIFVSFFVHTVIRQSHDSLLYHRVGDFYEACDVRALHVVDIAVFLGAVF